MAQNFRRYTGNNIGASPSTILTADSYDTVVGIHVTNIHTSAINVDVYINDGANDIYLVKAAPISVGGALQVLGTGKVVVQSGAVRQFYLYQSLDRAPRVSSCVLHLHYRVIRVISCRFSFAGTALRATKGANTALHLIP